MSNSKLFEVVRNLEQERDRMKLNISQTQKQLTDVDDAIKSIKNILNGMPAEKNQRNQKTHVGLTEEILAAQNRPVHIKSILAQIQKIRNKKISRATIETALSRHLKKVGKESRIERLGEGMYQIRQLINDSNVDGLFEH